MVRNSNASFLAVIVALLMMGCGGLLMMDAWSGVATANLCNQGVQCAVNCGAITPGTGGCDDATENIPGSGGQTCDWWGEETGCLETVACDTQVTSSWNHASCNGQGGNGTNPPPVCNNRAWQRKAIRNYTYECSGGENDCGCKPKFVSVAGHTCVKVCGTSVPVRP